MMERQLWVIEVRYVRLSDDDYEWGPDSIVFSTRKDAREFLQHYHRDLHYRIRKYVPAE